MGRKRCGKRKKLLVSSNFNFSLSHSVFKRLVQQTHKNQGLFGKALINEMDTYCFFNAWTIPCKQIQMLHYSDLSQCGPPNHQDQGLVLQLSMHSQQCFDDGVLANLDEHKEKAL